MKELEGLAEAAGAQVLGQMVQSGERPDKAPIWGRESGRIGEMFNMEANTVIFNNGLSGADPVSGKCSRGDGSRPHDSHFRHLCGESFFCRRTASGRTCATAVPASRLAGFGKSRPEQGRNQDEGPGEKKLEIDRRHIQSRMDEIRKDSGSTEIEEVQRSRREKSEIPVVALVGYTNAGKSAMMNALLRKTEKEEKSVMEKNMLLPLWMSHRRFAWTPTESLFSSIR